LKGESNEEQKALHGECHTWHIPDTWHDYGGLCASDYRLPCDIRDSGCPQNRHFGFPFREGMGFHGSTAPVWDFVVHPYQRLRYGWRHRDRSAHRLADSSLSR
jgi:hypothetical protein